MLNRVVITGVGPITPIGIGREAVWQSLHRPESGVRRITRFDTSGLRCKLAAEVHGFDPSRWIDPKPLRRMDRYARFCVAGARMAVTDAGLDISSLDASRIGCFIGSAVGGVSFGELQYVNYHSTGFRGIDASLALSVFVGAGPCNVAIQLGISGPASSNADSCASGTIAIGRAVQAIRQDEVDVAIAGAAEAPLTPLCFGAFDVIRAMSTHSDENPEAACRPFDLHRDGFVMGEGAALMVLESEEHARKRGATCLAYVAGHGLTNDAHHMTAPKPDGSGAARAILLALQDAGCTPDDVDVVSAHGCATPLNDRAETLALKDALGERAYHTPVIGTKSRHGHSLGASGAIEAAIFALGLHRQWLPAAMNLDTPDPECDLNYGQNGPTTGPFRTALSNSFGFGGINACLVLQAADVAPEA